MDKRQYEELIWAWGEIVKCFSEPLGIVSKNMVYGTWRNPEPREHGEIREFFHTGMCHFLRLFHVRGKITYTVYRKMLTQIDSSMFLSQFRGNFSVFLYPTTIKGHKKRVKYATRQLNKWKCRYERWKEWHDVPEITDL